MKKLIRETMPIQAKNIKPTQSIIQGIHILHMIIIVIMVTHMVTLLIHMITKTPISRVRDMVIKNIHMKWDKIITVIHIATDMVMGIHMNMDMAMDTLMTMVMIMTTAMVLVTWAKQSIKKSLRRPPSITSPLPRTMSSHSPPGLEPPRLTITSPVSQAATPQSHLLLMKTILQT